NRRMRSREALRQVERAFDVVVLPLKLSLVALFTLPHAQADLEHLLHPLVALFQRREGQARADSLLFVIAGSNAESGTSTRKHIQGSHGLRQQDRLPVGRRRGKGSQLDATGVGRKVCECRIAGEHLALWPTEIVALPDMVHDTDAIKAPGVGR